MEASPARQVADKVSSFSSQYGGDGSKSYTAGNLAGNSYNFPSYGDFTQAFVLRTYGPWWDLAPSFRPPFNKSRKNFISEDFVDLQFVDFVYPTKIEILETYNPGAVVRILALESVTQAFNKCRWTTLWSGVPQHCPPRSRKFSPPLRRTKYPTNLIRLEFNQSHLGYYTELDAVILYGKPAHSDSHEESKSITEPNDSEVHLTANLFRQLSLSGKKTEGQDDLENNGYFDILPSELMHYIFSFLELIDLTRAAFTCRLFFLHCYDPVWYKELDLKPYWSLRSLDLSWSGPYEAVSSTGLCRFLEQCGSKLVCLRLSCCLFVDNEVIKSVCQYCPNLEELDLQSCNSKSLDEEWALEAFKVEKYKTNQLTQSSGHRQSAASFYSVVHLTVFSISILVTVTCSRNATCSCRLLSTHCSGLVSLDLWRAKSLTDVGIVSLGDGCALLEELDVGWCSNVTAASECIVYLASKCRKLKKLFLTALRSVSDDVIYALADNCPDIEQVDVAGDRSGSC
ncbi:F-box and leucine-rich repeat protein 4 [Desmophyllum pertusum]|uniref:F-box and leucine-rich repeat protein 4 n=1 Tax=Desmophyllum pertusum TaxID=174260 RepID=A0A9X0D119_9CNID|nr:F-box and leucine-rich repeat protein 4 [Desmophyllum pertusum]